MAAATLGLGAEGWLQRPDLLLHDEYLRRAERTFASDIVLVAVTEDDIRAEAQALGVEADLGLDGAACSSDLVENRIAAPAAAPADD